MRNSPATGGFVTPEALGGTYAPQRDVASLPKEDGDGRSAGPGLWFARRDSHPREDAGRVVRIDETTAARLELEPGWKWSDCIKPIAKTESCQVRHVGLLQSGTMHVVHDDGSETEIASGQAYVIEPGHDAWVVGDEQVVAFEFESKAAEEFARGS